MKLVLAVIPPSRMEAVRQALTEVQVTRLSIVDGHGYQPIRVGQEPREGTAAERIVRHTVLEIAVNDDFLERTVTVLSRALRLAAEADSTPPSGDSAPDPGGVYVLPMDAAVQIYRDVRGPEAL